MPRRFAVGLAAIILAACGGGGGGGGAAPPPVTAAVKYALNGAIATPVPEGVVLDDGLGNTVPLAVGDTSFKFKEGQPYLNAGTTYNVSVKTQPKAYTCTTEKNTGTINANIFDVTVRCNGPLANASYVNYVGQRDGTFGFQSLALGKDGDYFVTVAFELFRVDAKGVMHRLNLLDMSTGAPLPEMTVRNVAVGSTGIVYLSVQRGTDQSALLRVRKTATEDVYLVETMAESFVDASGQRKNFGLSAGMSIDSADNLYVADKIYNVVRKISMDGVVSTFVGSGVAATTDGTGTGAAIQFRDYIVSMSHDANDNLYVEGDFDKNVIRKITPAGVVTSIPVQPGYRNTMADSAGNLYFVATTSTGIPSILRVSPAGVTDVLVSRGAVNFDSAPTVLRANALGYIQAMRIAGGYIYVAGHNPMVIYKIKI